MENLPIIVPSRKPKPKKVTFYMPDHLITSMKLYAVEHNMSFSGLVQDAVREYLAAREKGKRKRKTRKKTK